jgi:hypothetical protein
MKVSMRGGKILGAVPSRVCAVSEVAGIDF